MMKISRSYTIELYCLNGSTQEGRSRKKIPDDEAICINKYLYSRFMMLTDIIRPLRKKIQKLKY